jgi:hypothetical protein
VNSWGVVSVQWKCEQLGRGECTAEDDVFNCELYFCKD